MSVGSVEGLVREIVDLRGVSGATYRFRRWNSAEGSSVVAGNYAVLEFHGDGFKVMFTAMANDLSHPPGTVKDAIRKGGVGVYARLNVSRSVREAEDADINAYYRTAASTVRQQQAAAPI